MKARALAICILVISAVMTVFCIPSSTLSGSASIMNDDPINGNAPVPEDYEMDVKGGDYAVVGVRPEAGDDFDLEVYTDTSFSTLIDSSITSGDAVDLVALEKDKWTSPPTKGVRVTKGSTSYVIEMENDLDSHLFSDTWTGTMDEYPGNPILDLGPPGSWDDHYVYSPSVIFDGTTYHMWYGGNDNPTRRIGYATSPDGIKWTRYSGNPVLDVGPPGSWDDEFVYWPSVIFDGTIYHMWYAGGNGNLWQIGYSSSTDGISWTKSSTNPVLGPGPNGAWDDIWVFSPEVLFDGTTYNMWYTGYDGSIRRTGYAVSTDRITWIKYSGNPVLDVGPSGTWDDYYASVPQIVDVGGTYHMVYTGHDGSTFGLGYASSFDGVNWVKEPSNPILHPGPSGSWDDRHLLYTDLMYDGTEFHLWYSGGDGTNIRIGYATSSDAIKWTKLTERAEVLDAYEITGFNSGSSYTIDLEVPSTADLDMFIYDSTGGRDDAVASSTTVGSGVAESIGFMAPSSGDYLLIITNENGGVGEYTIKPGSSPPVADAGEDQIMDEGNNVKFNGSSSYTPNREIISYEWDFESDGIYDYQETPTNAPDGTFDGKTNQIYGDNGLFTATLRIIDETNQTDTDTCNITVLNVDPIAVIESITMDVEISLRMAGSKWSNAGMTLYEEDRVIGFMEVERWPGSPEDNPYNGNPSIPISLDLTKEITAIITYDPYPDSGDAIRGDQPNNGKDKHDNAGNPVWVVVKFPNGSEERAHHTFNTQQSKKRGSTHPNHVDPWEVNIMELLVGHYFEVTSHITDPGSDDIELTFTYGSHLITKEYLNDPPIPDPYPSPEVNPRIIWDETTILYEGEGTLVMLVSDDDSGEISTYHELK